MGEWPIHEPGDLIVAGAAMMFVGGIVAFLFARFFCARPAPRWLHWWRDLAIGLLGARLIGARVFDAPLDWFSGLIYINIGLTQVVIALWRWWHVMGAQGDRCE